MNKKLNVAVVGAYGRMGRAILNLLINDDTTQCCGAVDSSSIQDIGKPLMALGISSNVILLSDKKQGLQGADAVIDFTSVPSSLETAEICAENKQALVIGTTGFTKEELEKLKILSHQTAIMISPNMSLGVNLLFKLANQVASILGSNYDVEIIESHHNKKVDSPSGTAQRLKEEILHALNRKEQDVIYGRKGIIGKRNPAEIAVHSIRAGDIVGEHTVLFAGHGEKIEIKHTALSRDTFASGAINAAKYLFNQKNNKPGFYQMKDMFTF